jgi:putative redox protein
VVDWNDMKLTATFHGGTRYDIVSGQHRIITDQSAEDGGRDAGMSPVELFVGSVASCVAYFVGQFCERHSISRDGLSVDAEWTMAEGPHRVGRIDIAIHLPHRIPGELKERLLKVAHACTVHQSPTVAPNVTISLNPQSQGGVQSSRGKGAR